MTQRELRVFTSFAEADRTDAEQYAAQSLLQNKRASGRPKDLADIAKLTAVAAVRKRT